MSNQYRLSFFWSYTQCEIMNGIRLNYYCSTMRVKYGRTILLSYFTLWFQTSYNYAIGGFYTTAKETMSNRRRM